MSHARPQSKTFLGSIEKYLEEGNFPKASELLSTVLLPLQMSNNPLKIPEPIKKFTVIESYFTLYQIYLRYKNYENVAAAERVLRSLEDYLCLNYSVENINSKKEEALSNALFSIAVSGNLQKERSVHFVEFLKYSLNKAEKPTSYAQALLEHYCYCVSGVPDMKDSDFDDIFGKLDEKLNASKEKSLIAEVIHEYAEKLSHAGKYMYAEQLYTKAIDINLNLVTELLNRKSLSKNDVPNVQKYINAAAAYAKGLKEFPLWLTENFIALGWKAYRYNRGNNELCMGAKNLFREVSNKSSDITKRLEACINAVKCIITAGRFTDEDKKELSDIADQAMQLAENIVNNKIAINFSIRDHFAECAGILFLKRMYKEGGMLSSCSSILAAGMTPATKEESDRTLTWKRKLHQKDEEIAALKEKIAQLQSQQKSDKPAAMDIDRPQLTEEKRSRSVDELVSMTPSQPTGHFETTTRTYSLFPAPVKSSSKHIAPTHMSKKRKIK